MKKMVKLLLAGLAILTCLVYFGIKPTQVEFVCQDSTSRCNDTWGGSFWVPVNKQEIHLDIYGYEVFNKPIFWLIFISKRHSDIVAPKDTRVSWFNHPFEQSNLIPDLAIQKIKDGYFNDRYEFTFEGNRIHKIIMGDRNQYFNPLRFRNGKFKNGVW
jgi:hypothetical protein